MTTATTTTTTADDAGSSGRIVSGLRARPLLVSFVATFVLIEVLSRLLAAQMPEPLVWPRYEVQRKVDDLTALGATDCADVVVYGSSIGNAAVDAGRLETALGGGRRVYNASLGGAGIDAIERWHDEVVGPAACPRHVIVAVSVRDLNDATPSGDFNDRYDASLGRADHLGTTTTSERIELWALDNIGLVQLRQVLRNPATAASWLRNEGGPWREINDDHGTLIRFVDRSYNASESRRIHDREVVFAGYETGGARTDELTRFLSGVGAEGAVTSIVMLPFTETETIELLPNGHADIEHYRAAVTMIADGSGAELIDLTSVANDRDHFADDYHANGAGAAAITDALAAHLTTG